MKFLGKLSILLTVACACGSARVSPPPAQPSSTEPASALLRVSSGAPFAPACLIVDVGATVEWRNLSPRSSIIVLSVRDPYELSSPSLASPYNFISPAESDECTQRVNGACVEPLPFSYWRHTFLQPGIFDYKDQSGSASAAAATTGDGDSYGLPPGPVASASGGTGTVCVRGPESDCAQVCCTGTQANECATGISCVSGRCGGVVP